MFFLLWILMGVVGRLGIHIPDVTPITSLCLFAPTVFSKKNSFLITFIILFLSDLLLHFIFGFAIFGSWTLFTYSGWFFITALGFIFAKQLTLTRSMFFSFYAAIVFWIWTNFGTWCATNLYSHDLNGLWQCYVAALPFLRNSIIGACAWSGVLFFILRSSKYATISSSLV